MTAQMRCEEHFPKEFRPQDSELEKICIAGGTDISWHNDGSPSWGWNLDKGEDPAIWLYVNPVNKEDREIPEFPRFIAMLNDEDSTTVYDGESLTDALSAIANKVAS